MGGHVFLDGVAIGLAFKVDNALGVAVFIAILVSCFFRWPKYSFTLDQRLGIGPSEQSLYLE